MKKQVKAFLAFLAAAVTGLIGVSSVAFAAVVPPAECPQDVIYSRQVNITKRGTSFYGNDTNEVIVVSALGVDVFAAGGDDCVVLLKGADRATVKGQAGNDTLVSYANAADLFGNDGNDTIRSYGNADILDGGIGNDVVQSYGTNDSVHGGTGVDTCSQTDYFGTSMDGCEL
jgi:Ca2+-binding RTX toxin-like protein